MIALLGPYAIVLVLNLFGGAIATLGVGLALTSLGLNIVGVFIAIIVADTVSDTVYYCIGRFASHALRARFIKPRSKNARRYNAVKRYFDDHGKSTVFLGKMSDILAVPAVMLAGAVRMPYHIYLAISVATSALKAIIILAAGYLISRSTDPSDAHFVVYGLGGLFLVVLMVVVARQIYATITKTAGKH